MPISRLWLQPFVMGAGCTVEQQVLIAEEAPTEEVSIEHDCDEVLLWGSNLRYQLGFTTNCEDIKREPLSNEPKRPHMILEHAIKSFDAGPVHSALITELGSVYTFGDGKNGKLGHGFERDEPIPRLVTPLLGIRALEVACGPDFNLILTAMGRVYSFGAGTSGQLGLGAFVSQAGLPCLLEAIADKHIIHISAGLSSFASAVADDGLLYTWGSNADGQLGHGADKSSRSGSSVMPPIATPTIVHELVAQSEQVVGMDCGFAHMCVVTAAGKLFAWGEGRAGQLGQGFRFAAFKPVEIELPAVPAAVTCGGTHTVVLTTAGELWAWGSGSHGQLGLGGTGDQLRPVRVHTQGAVTQVTAGLNHTLCVCLNGRVLAWGSNLTGQIAKPLTTKQSSLPEEISALPRNILTIGCGHTHSAALLQNSHVRKVADHLETYVDNPQHSDVTLISSDGEFVSAHLVLIAARLPFLLTSGTADTVANKEIAVPLPAAVLRNLLVYVYSDRLSFNLSADVVTSLARYAKAWNLVRLQRLCARAIRQQCVVPDSTLLEDIRGVLSKHSTASLRGRDGEPRKVDVIFLTRIRAMRLLFAASSSATVDLSSEAVAMIIAYAYHGTCASEKLEAVLEVLSWACKNNDQALIFDCVTLAVTRHLNDEVAVRLLLVAQANNLVVMETHCVQYIQSHPESQVSEEIEKLPREMLTLLSSRPMTPRERRKVKTLTDSNKEPLSLVMAANDSLV